VDEEKLREFENKILESSATNDRDRKKEGVKCSIISIRR